MIGDGSKLEIKHVGSGTLPTYINFNLSLHELLHVPNITKNLISISKLTTDNDVFVEFFSDLCYVKDKVTRQVLVQGKLRDGLYQFEVPTRVQPCANSFPRHKSSQFSGLSVGSKQSVFQSRTGPVSVSIKDVWHNCLGHPPSRVLNSILEQLNVNHANMNESFCNVCQLGKCHYLPFKINHFHAKQLLEMVHSDI